MRPRIDLIATGAPSCSIVAMLSSTSPHRLGWIAGILSVWYSRKENILVYPTGLVNTIFYVYLSFKMSLLGEASVNLYYTALNIYGWVAWTRKDRQQQYPKLDCSRVHRSALFEY